MKRVILGALDYGVAFGVDRTLRELLADGRLSAVGCLAASPLWSREYKPMQEIADTVGSRGLVGVTIALSGDRVTPVSGRMVQTYGETMPAPSKWARRAFFRLLPDDLLSEEVEAQLQRFTDLMEREPDFVAVRDGLLAHGPVARLVTKAIGAQEYRQPPSLISPDGSRLVEGRLTRFARKAGLKVVSKGPSMPPIPDVDVLQNRMKSHFNGLGDMAFVASIPGKADDRLRREEPREKIAIREAHREVLSSGQFFQTLVERDIYLN